MKTNTPEKFFINQLFAHKCQLPPSDDYQYLRLLKKSKNWFLISERSLESYLKAKSLSRIYYEKRRQVRTTQVVIHPFSKFRKMWIIWMSFVLLSSFIMLPFFAAFHGPVYARSLYHHNKPFINFWLILYVVLIIQVACLVDIIVNFFTGYATVTPEEMVIQPWRILREYVFTYFFLDLASSIPIDFIVITVWGVEKYSQLQKTYLLVMVILPFLKFFRLYTFYKYWSVVFSIFSSSEPLYNVFCVTAFFFLFIHWSTCVTVLISQFKYYNYLFDESFVSGSWIFRMRLHDKNILSRYVCALYRSVTCLTRLGFELFITNTIEDKIISTVLGIFGGIYLLVLLVVFLQATSAIARSKTSYAEIVDQVNEYMEFKKFPRDLKRKVSEYYLCLYQKHYIDENAILKLASDTLRKEILLRMYQRLVESMNIFSSLGETLTIRILSNLRPQIFREGEIAFKVADASDCMYFISFGTFAFFRKDGLEIGHIDDGNYFGGLSLLHNSTRYLTAVAIETSLVYRLDSADFNEILRPEKSFVSRLEKDAEVWLRKAQQALRQQRERNKSFKKTFSRDSDEEDYTFNNF